MSATLDLLSPASTPHAGVPRPVLLLVEDDPAIRRVLVRWLSLQRFEVLCAEDGFAAERLWRQHRERINIVVSDVTLPNGPNGTALARQVRSYSQQTPVILTTGYNIEDTRAGFEQGTNTQFLAKPYQPAELLALVRNALQFSSPENLLCTKS